MFSATVPQSAICVQQDSQITINMQVKILPLFILITEDKLLILYLGIKVGLETQ